MNNIALINDLHASINDMKVELAASTDMDHRDHVVHLMCEYIDELASLGVDVSRYASTSFTKQDAYMTTSAY